MTHPVEWIEQTLPEPEEQTGIYEFWSGWLGGIPRYLVLDRGGFGCDLFDIDRGVMTTGFASIQNAQMEVAQRRQTIPTVEQINACIDARQRQRTGPPKLTLIQNNPTGGDAA